MSVRAILDKYSASPHLFQLVDSLSFAQPQKLWARNLRGSASQFVSAAVFLHPSASQLNHVFICNEAEDAAYFHNTLESLTEALNLFLFSFLFQEPQKLPAP